MRTNLLLDVAELAISKVPISRRVYYINPVALYDNLLSGNTVCKSIASKSEFMESLKIMFPVYKNKKRGTLIFKITIDAPYIVSKKLGIKLRPLNHINRGHHVAS